MKTKKILSAVLAVVMLHSAGADAYAEDEALHISTAEDLAAFAASCSLDSYSDGLRVVLDKDIDLCGVPFLPIPVFRGEFDGAGHTVSGFVLAADGSNQGFFRYIGEGGAVRDLKIQGSVKPGSSKCKVGGIVGSNSGSVVRCAFSGTVEGKNYVGGIAGENFGSIVSCEVSGTVLGKRFTGGIAGYSTGTVSFCENSAAVNTSITDGGLELDELELSGLMSIDLSSAEDTDVVSDTGGIAGYTSGSVLNCENNGEIGYQHYGYNVGGIAGRQCGILSQCVNNGWVLGRKDVGGIVGQMEPYLILKDKVSLDEELEILIWALDATLSNAGRNADSIVDALNDIKDSAGSAADKLRDSNPISSPPPLPTGEPTPPSPPAEEPDVPSSPSPEGQNGPTGPESAGNLSSRPPVTLSGSGSVLHMAPIRIGTRRLEAPKPDGGNEEPGAGGDGGLNDDLRGMADGMGELNGAIDETAGTLFGDMKTVNYHLGCVLNILVGYLSGTDMEKLQDVSGDDPEANQDGKVSGCKNTADVEADQNVGGIAGTMGIEYEFDVGSVLSENLGSREIISSVFEARCVSMDNVNEAAVTGKKNYVGGVVGLEELGTVLNCENYGDTQSPEGSYVGGVAGKAMGSIRNSYAMCRLDGEEYVGGIAGYAAEMHDCISMVKLGDVTACAGTIAGSADISDRTKLSGNRSIGGDTGAIDGISYIDIAWPGKYEELADTAGIPERIITLTVTFTADGKELGKTSFSYGHGIKADEYPEIPEKKGYTGFWPDTDLSRLTFDTTVEAGYLPNKTSLAAAATADGTEMLPVLVQGEFRADGAVAMEKCRADGLTAEGTVLDCEKLTVSGTVSKKYTVRYLSPPLSFKTDKLDIYVLAPDGVWQRVNTRTVDSYTLFETEGGEVIFAAVESAGESRALLYAGAGAAALVFAALLIKQRRAGKKKTAEQPAEVTD